jgi:hypothetical protein
MRLIRFPAPCALSGLALSLLGGCAHIQTPDVAQKPEPQNGVLSFNSQDKRRWEVVNFPGKPKTQFQLDTHDQRLTMRAIAKSSASMLRQRLNLKPEQLGRLSFDWQADNLIGAADMAQRDSEDSPLRVILAFEGDRSRFSAKNAMLNELSRSLTGEEMPYATLMYVWCNHRPVESVIVNPRTDRIRKLVVESGPGRLKQWLHYERDIRADYEKAFGEPPGALVGLAIMTDTDNTQSQARAWYGDIRLD